jgi:AcrR family transcriptional regulator
MVAAMTAAVAERGYAATSVAEVIDRAGVSRETFYEQFANKEACFDAAFDLAVAELGSRVVAGGGDANGADPLVRLDAALGAYLEALAGEPELARTFLIEVYGAGPAILRRRAAVMERFAEALAEGLGAREEARFACRALVAATSSMVTMRIAAGKGTTVTELHPDLMRLARQLLGPGEADGAD